MHLPVVRVDGLFAGVAVPAGVQSITVRYMSSAVQTGAWISVIATCLLSLALGSRRGLPRIPPLPPERRDLRVVFAGWPVLGAAALVAACAAADVGGVRDERARASLAAAAARSWSAEALGALRAGAPDAAARLLRAAMDADPRDPVHAYRLGLAEREAGREAESRAALRRALEIDAGFAPARRELEDRSDP